MQITRTPAVPVTDLSVVLLSAAIALADFFMPIFLGTGSCLSNS